jgi:hypothetical protein
MNPLAYEVLIQWKARNFKYTSLNGGSSELPKMIIPAIPDAFGSRIAEKAPT